MLFPSGSLYDGVGGIKLKKGYVKAVHLIYIIIIAVIINAFFLVIAFGGSKTASTQMGTAATVSSLILSVIAIVMTIVDVAGQRNTVTELKETAEKLQVNLNTVDESIAEIGILKRELMESMSAISVSNELIIKEIIGLKGKYEKSDDDSQSVDNKEFLKDLDELSNRIKTVRILPHYRKGLLVNEHFRTSLELSGKEQESLVIKIILKSINDKSKEFKLADLLWICEETNVSRAFLKNTLKKLVEKGVLYREGEYYKFNNN